MPPLDFIYQRQSIRRFTDQPVDDADLEAILTAATYAPSGKNLQNWHFVVVKSKETIEALAAIVARKNADLAALLPPDKAKSLSNMAPYHTVFKYAPVVILVYAGPYPTVADDLAGIDRPLATAAATDVAAGCPGVQNAAAALENLLLAAAALGYGTCWMTGPTYAAAEITAYLGFDKPGYHLTALTPLGIPAGEKSANPRRKPLNEVVTIIE